MINIPFPLKQSFAKLAGAGGNLARSCESQLNLPNGLKKTLKNKMQINQHPFPQLKTESPFKLSRFAVNYNFAPMAGVTRYL